MLWYLGGLYLIFLGFLLLLNDSDIFVGFLWVIDLGVGLIFFIFIMHFSNFIHQKSNFDVSSRFVFFFFVFLIFLTLFYWIFSGSSKSNFNSYLQNNWFFYVSWYNYYNIFLFYGITELNLLREIYFYNNSFEFFLINFVLFYGLFTSINFCFLLKKIFIFLNFSQIKNINILSVINSTFFIRNQNFLMQQNTSTGTRVWQKKKKTLNDF